MPPPGSCPLQAAEPAHHTLMEDTVTTTPTRVSVDDLRAAQTWLLALEGESGAPVAAQDPADDDDDQAAMRRVAAWISAEVERRELERAARTVAAKRGVSVTRARQAIRATLAR